MRRRAKRVTSIVQRVHEVIDQLFHLWIVFVVQIQVTSAYSAENVFLLKTLAMNNDGACC